jgi:hypothetical protein
MMSGTLTYWAQEGRNRMRTLKLTFCCDDERRAGDLRYLRRMRLTRILTEAGAQGARLGYKDLSVIMLTSKATLKRDVSFLRRNGFDVRLRGNV